MSFLTGIFWVLAGLFAITWYIIIFELWTVRRVFRPQIWRLQFAGDVLFGVTITVLLGLMALRGYVSRLDPAVLIWVLVGAASHVVAALLKALGYIQMGRALHSMKSHLDKALNGETR